MCLCIMQHNSKAIKQMPPFFYRVVVILVVICYIKKKKKQQERPKPYSCKHVLKLYIHIHVCVLMRCCRLSIG